jgi:hypothetical protein
MFLQLTSAEAPHPDAGVGQHERVVVEQPMRCGRCGEVIGIYEPLVLAHEGLVRATSVAGEPRIAAEPGERFHRACYAENPAGSTADTGVTWEAGGRCASTYQRQ